MNNIMATTTAEERAEYRKANKCGTKRGYKTKSRAKEDVKRARKNNNLRLESYDCPHCEFWHLGTKRTGDY